MKFSAIRMAENEDLEAVKKAAERFCHRHGISFGSDADDTAEVAIGYRIYKDSEIGEVVIKNAWQRVFCRAIGQPYNAGLTIQHDHIGIRR